MADLAGNEPPGKRRILCIDGGGLLGTFPAAFLAGLEEHTQKPIGRYFDLIAGTSTGAIIAAGLAQGMRVVDLHAKYMALGAEVFQSGWFRWGIARSSYDAKPLVKKLKELFGEHATLGPELYPGT